jgi:hypothetical protein
VAFGSEVRMKKMPSEMMRTSEPPHSLLVCSGEADRPCLMRAATMTEVADKRNAIKPLLASAQFLS